MALGVIGIDPDAESVFQVLLSGRPATVSELADATGMPPPRVRAAVEVLAACRLADVRPGAAPGGQPAYQAADPAIALDVLLLAREQEIKNARLLAQELAERYRLAAGKRDPAELVEVVSGSPATLERVQQAQRTARQQLRGFDKPPYGGNPTAVNQVEAGLLRRGGTVRNIYERAAVEVPGRLADLEAGISLGEQARVLPSLPTKAVIVDDTLAILPLQAAPEAIESTVVVHKSGLLEAVIALFETLWELAIPLRLPTADWAARDQPSAEERRILALLTAGTPDDVIARELRLSERTYQRRVRGLMERVNAQTRFQLARQAARRGWLDDAAPEGTAKLGQRAVRATSRQRRGGGRTPYRQGAAGAVTFVNARINARTAVLYRREVPSWPSAPVPRPTSAADETIRLR
ncbi:MAG: helix-turn-helix transcriptional regulator [Streptosporangiaceae bacterium]